MSTLERAICIAADGHRGQVDKAGAPYILHVLRVMMAMPANEERIVAVLHDLLEDTTWTTDDLRREGFSESIVEAIDSLTRREGEDYDAFIARVATNPISRQVKLADLADNADISRFPAPTPQDYARKMKYERATQTLREDPQQASMQGTACSEPDGPSPQLPDPLVGKH
jgi:(p)ppGpp synthase/HD superfamily hydrolase